MENIKVEVMMSSYNGAEFLCEQVKSILLQENVNVHLTIRDDGSTDQTREILKEFEKDSRISVVTGQNIGWKKVFYIYLIMSNLRQIHFMHLQIKMIFGNPKN